ncbi:MAG: YciI family protein [Balneolaceae bacterium]
MFQLKLFQFLVVLFMLNPALHGQNSNPNYDENLASELGGDEYGMKNYILVILKTGSNDTSDREFIAQQFSGHMKNIERLANDGKLVLAGPLAKNNHAYRGIFILDVATKTDAEELLQTDPAIRENLLAAELFEWYGSAALPEYLEASDKIWKKKP